MQPSSNPFFTKLDMIILVCIFIALAVAYLMNNGIYKQYKQNVIIVPSLLPSITGIIASQAPTNLPQNVDINQCAEDKDCGRNKKCEEGLCVKIPLLQPTVSSTSGTISP